MDFTALEAVIIRRGEIRAIPHAYEWHRVLRLQPLWASVPNIDAVARVFAVLAGAHLCVHCGQPAETEQRLTFTTSTRFPDDPPGTLKFALCSDTCLRACYYTNPELLRAGW